MKRKILYAYRPVLQFTILSFQKHAFIVNRGIPYPTPTGGHRSKSSEIHPKAMKLQNPGLSCPRIS